MKLICTNPIKMLIVFLMIAMNYVYSQPINPNGGFEEGTTGIKTGSDIPGWVIFAEGGSVAIVEVEDYDVQEGAHALTVEANALGSNSYDLQVVNDPFNVVPGTTYNVSIWAKADQAGPIVNFTIGNPSYTEWGRKGVAMTTDWQQVTMEFTAPTDATTGRMPLHLSASDNNAFLPIIFFFDNLEISVATVDVEDESPLPAKFKLGQNYPNPFNPETTIDFSVPQKSDVRIELVNTLGQVVKEIISGNFIAGSHQVKLNASDLSSGIYFYKLIAGNFVDVKKLVLMK